MRALTRWDEEHSLSHTLSILRELARPHFADCGAEGAHLIRLMDEGRWSELVNYNLEQNVDGLDVMWLINMRQGLGFFTKLEDLDIGLDKTEVAVETFMKTEQVCAETNAFFRLCRTGNTQSCVPNVVRLIEIARRKIRFVLKACPKIGELKFQFGPGATTVTKRKQSCPMQKMASGFQCSSNLLASKLLPEVLRSVPHWLNAFESDPYITEDGWLATTVPVEETIGKLVCVPKSAKTYRTILVEPNLNAFVQQGIRQAMESRLKQAGLSTDDQSRNARLARQGSIHNDLATIDLSSASDLICYELVKALLPSDWFHLLNYARTGAVLVNGTEIRLEKFSSMGNAKTFPLETLIFWAISTAAPEVFGSSFKQSDVAVYGDDIIVPTSGARQVYWALNAVGFSVNTAKSYVSGPFRESCGHDYYNGVNVRPFYQKHLVSCETLFTLYNFYKRNLDEEAAKRVLQFIPRPLRLYGPDGYGDGHLLSDSYPSFRRAKMNRCGYGGHLFETFTKIPCKIRSKYPGDWISPLYSIYVSDTDWKTNLALPEKVAVKISKSGVPFWSVPGTNGYKRTLIYTLVA